MTTDFSTLRKAAQKAAVNFRPNNDCSVGSVGAALLTNDGVLYTGTCIDLPCGIGFCAEHAAVAAMLKDKRTQIKAVVALTHDGKVLPPCGRCRELMDLIDRRNQDAEVLVADGKSVRLRELLPFPFQDV